MQVSTGSSLIEPEHGVPDELQRLIYCVTNSSNEVWTSLQNNKIKKKIIKKIV